MPTTNMLDQSRLKTFTSRISSQDHDLSPLVQLPTLAYEAKEGQKQQKRVPRSSHSYCPPAPYAPRQGYPELHAACGNTLAAEAREVHVS